MIRFIKERLEHLRLLRSMEDDSIQVWILTALITEYEALLEAAKESMDFCVDPETKLIYGEHYIGQIESGDLAGNYHCERCGRMGK